ncbi:AAA family ATPase [Enteroscipio rubneri]|uniref:AAA family ATPase n=1 Tax=Enteroscipio rubneri TaxID=2070686 RepID=UPI0032081ED6
MPNDAMIRLSGVVIHNYKCIENDQSFDVEPDVTVLVGMNESGKTTALEAIAKCHYFDEGDPEFKFEALKDYPRARYNKYKRGDEPEDAVTLRYEISEGLKSQIEIEMGISLEGTDFTCSTYYDGKTLIGINSLFSKSWASKVKEALNKMAEEGIPEERLLSIKARSQLDSVLSEYDLGEDDKTIFESLREMLPVSGESKWEDPVKYAIWKDFLEPNLPVFIYYDEYYQLPGRVDLSKLKNASLSDPSLKTAKALIDLSGADLDILSAADDFEEFKSELEATSIDISDTLFEYWGSNQNLEIEFDVDKVESDDGRNHRIVKRVLDIRVKNKWNRVSLPLDKRSKGFNWFFSFLVWFKAMQEDRNRQYILLLDEPGLNLHALAQGDLLRFIDDLSEDHQIIYTTHSPFMVDSEHLEKIRTVVEVERQGSRISDSLQEKDPDTLFPLQAALGYSVAQNLFINKKNLLVEGISDLVYLETMSAELLKRGRTGLSEEATIVPTGGADKVATFISLMRGSKLQIVCLLDSFVDKKSKQRIDDLVREKIIRDKNIVYYSDVRNTSYADVEDMFEPEEYLLLYNAAFDKNVSISDIKSDRPIMIQLKDMNGGAFNHYLPAREFARRSAEIDLSDETLERFENLFSKLNSLL